MKRLFFIPLAFMMSFCKCPKAAISESNKSVIESVCPEEGKCTVELLKNKSLDVKADEFGSLYYQISESNETSVLIYRYDKNVPKDLQDANYREEIIFEINNKTQTLILSGKDLQQSKMIYGRFGFGKGQTGNYKVQEGNLNLKREGDTVRFDLNFKVGQVPLLINPIKATVK
ncbi:hypothetical protein [Flavobacterium sangjuense]|uniref:Uncharacterized protein n=1 Tax=Flavobacterium sangjuense TaxID=2518177 RepID=A0A4P7PS15_9FLAO|nr:hypothetical protein [Flavobacterium sangjuense]QBZ97325.1 hypothetical protein GS03_00811 [Flavobacterium sangjuense]